MENNSDTQGPIIDRDKRETKPYSKRIIFVGLFVVAAVIFTIANMLPTNEATSPKTVISNPKPSAPTALREPYIPPEVPPLPPTPAPQEKPAVIIFFPPPQQKHPTNASNPEYRKVAEQLKAMDKQAILSPPVTGSFGDDNIAAAEGGVLQAGGTNLASLMNLVQQRRAPSQNTSASTANSVQQSNNASPSNQNSLLEEYLQQQGGANQNRVSSTGGDNQSRQAQKEDFLRNSGSTLTHQGYSTNIPIPQQFPLELKAGTVIPGLLLTGLNSELPGPVMGQVSENVWDSTHGSHVLIPKGTRILGVYNSMITFGQKRLAVVWNRLIFPNGTTLNIAGSPGLDQSGYSGMRGKVDEHWGRMLNAALFASLFITAAEMISPRDDRYFNVTRTPGQVFAEQLGTAVTNVGTKLMDREIDNPPTITIRPGRRFNIFVDKDIVFPTPYPIGLQTGK